MKVTIRKPQEIIIHCLEEVTLKQFLNLNHNSQAMAWLDGYLIMLTHHEEELRDEQIQKGIWSFRHVVVASMPKFEETISGRHAKVSVFDQSGDTILEAIINEVKKK